MGYQTTIEKQGLWTIFDIKGDAGAVAQRISFLELSLPATANTKTAKGGQHLCWVGANHWILLAHGNEEGQLNDSLAPNDAGLDCRIVLVSDAYTIFTVTGNQADDILAIASPLDTRRTIFGDDGATYTELFGIQALVLRRPDGYIVAIERSYADMITKYFGKVSTGSR